MAWARSLRRARGRHPAARNHIVIVGGGITLWTGWYVVDSLIRGFIGLTFLGGSWRVLRALCTILFEATPEGIVVRAVAKAMGSTAGVMDQHDLHLSSMCSGYPALSAHAPVADASCVATTS